MELQGMEDALACLDTKGSAVISVSRLFSKIYSTALIPLELVRVNAKLD